MQVRCDKVIQELPKKKKCVDDVCGCAETLHQLFQDTTEFLTIMGNLIVSYIIIPEYILNF